LCLTDSSFSFLIVISYPGEDEITVLGEDGPAAPTSPVYIPVSLPTVMFPWTDGDLCERVTQGTLLLSGCEAVECRIDPNGKGTTLTMDMSSSLMFDPEKYYEGHYGPSHPKIVAMKVAIKKIKGGSMKNPVKCTHKRGTGPTKIEKEFVDEGGDDVRVLKFGKKKNIQMIAHMDMAGIRSGHFDHGGKNVLEDTTS
jgi:hypothetical protein